MDINVRLSDGNQLYPISEYPSISKNRCQRTSLISGHSNTTTTGMAAGSRGNNGQSASTSTCADLMSCLLGLLASLPVGNPESQWQIGTCVKAPKQAIQQKNACALPHCKGEGVQCRLIFNKGTCNAQTLTYNTILYIFRII